MDNENRRRLFADVVSIDAWHSKYDANSGIADLKSDVVFGVARLGAEPESPVRFRLRVRRAEVIVVVPEMEPVSVARSSVQRSGPPRAQGKIRDSLVFTKNFLARASAKLLKKRGSGAFEASTEIEASGAISSKRSLDSETEYSEQIVTTSKTSEGYYRWVIEAVDGRALVGRPWDANELKLQLIDKRTDSKSISPIVRVEVRCRREDLVITDLETKDADAWGLLKKLPRHKSRVVAAEAYIREKLLQQGLAVGDISEKFGELTLGEVIAEESN